MKIKKIFLYITITIFTTFELFAQNTNPVVTNVTVTNNNETIIVYYDVVDAETDDLTIYMEVSIDDGISWNFDYGVATGDIGIGVKEGIGKTITWEYPNCNNKSIKVEIYADDNYGDQIYYARNIYNTIKIGDQIWLKENIDVGTMINTGSYERNNNIIEKRCYNNNLNNCEIYGGLYIWTEAMKYSDMKGSQGICPNNWHIPTYDEFQILINEVGGSSDALKALGANSSNFTALLAGTFYDGRYFSNLGNYGWFWSSTDSSSSYAAKQMMIGSSDNIELRSVRKTECCSIRCLKN